MLAAKWLCPKSVTIKVFNRHASVASCTPIKKYSKLLAEGVMVPDQCQFNAMNQLQRLFNSLQDYETARENTSNPAMEQPQGVYMYGGVGTGKTLLLDIFYDCVPTEKKKRVHFNSFMLYLYSELNRWNLCCEEEVDFLSPVEHIANKIMEEAWLLCFDEIQVSDYASVTLLEGIFGNMIAKGAVVVGTSNRSPEQLGSSSISGENDEIEVKNPSSFQSLFVDNFRIHHLESERDHRVEMKHGESRFLYPLTPKNQRDFNEMFAATIPPGVRMSSTFLDIYKRKILIPVSAGDVARFSFKELCCMPLGSADYIMICNTYSKIFVEDVPKMTINQKNEARRFLTFIDAAYECRVQVYCTAEAAPEDLFLMIPREEGDYNDEQMHMEMIGEIAYDLQLAGLDFKALNLISGEDEIFSFKRAISRLKEMQSTFYQSTAYRKQLFSPYTGTDTEKVQAQEKRLQRERNRLQKLAAEQEANREKVTEEQWSLPNRDFRETDWGDEASYSSISQEAVAFQNKRSLNNRQKDAPKFGPQHFWGFGWWEHVKNKIKSKNEKQ